MIKRPKILVLGWGRHGKDTVADILRDDHGFRSISSSYFCAERVMMPYFERIGRPYTSAEECFNDRHTDDNRAIWHQQIKVFNSPDRTLLTRAILAENDMYVGMRCPIELEASRPIFDFICWVDSSARGIPPEDKSSCGVEYDPSYMWLIRNDSDIDGLKRRVEDFMQFVEMSEEPQLSLNF